MNFKGTNVYCKICNKVNHYTPKCLNSFDPTSELENPPKSFKAMNRSLDRPDPTLYADSGAITHILNDLGKITKVTPYEKNESLCCVKDSNSD